MSSARRPADIFLEEAIVALESADVSALGRLADGAAGVGMPESRRLYECNRDIFAALLEATARNLRLLRRTTR